MPELSYVLNVWWDNRLVGRFERTANGVTFAYDLGVAVRPISLSLPLEGGWSQHAPERFLENLLPDNKALLARWAHKYHTAESPFDLLWHVGGDVAGALSLLPDGVSPYGGARTTIVATEDEIAGRIATLRQDESAWLPDVESEHVRFSLAGTQAKFSLTKVGESWLWPNESTPSTHIFKPGSAEYPEIEKIEAATMVLAKSVGVPAANETVTEFFNQHALVVERFDRERPNSEVIPSRIHAEDLAQALGRSPRDKYNVSLIDVLNTLKAVDSELPYSLIQQVAFNVAIGNSDAHAKNYSLLFNQRGVSLSPLYDSIPTILWSGKYGNITDKLAMSIGGAKRPQELTPSHWEGVASRTGLDGDKVVSIARQVAHDVNECVDEAFTQSNVAPATVDRLVELVNNCTRQWREASTVSSSAHNPIHKQRLVSYSSPKGVGNGGPPVPPTPPSGPSL